MNKFHTAIPPIQALWLVAGAATVLGVAWLLTRTLREIMAPAARPPRPEAGDLLVYGVVQDEHGQWHVIRHGHAPQPVDWTNPPRELLGHGFRAE
ncbi:hypothetical protein [Microvirga lenta]|uniref:hypothetical protein n=1 Tax=Microvirga lenta TaxID=2881337 RepID=UPI001CFF5E98|nr:hypothetical protein [Microvirga lenta]MCB5175229.1 hypothetical protein [Microvirga lenta]